MRKFFLIIAVSAVFFSLSAQDSTNDLYQQYMNQYTNNQPAQAEPAKPAEAAPAQAEPAKPAAEPEKKEEPAKEEKKEDPASAPAENESKEEAQAVEESAPAENADETENGNKLDFSRNPYFSVNAFGATSVGIDVYGGEVNKDDSYRFSLDNAVVDLKGGDHMFNGRILFDLAKLVDDDGNISMYNILKDVSFRMEHPTYRSQNGFGLNVNLQAGLFGLPFGIESGYDHEITFMNSAIKDKFLGGAFRDVGVSVGTDLIFNPESDLAITLFVFNGKNETMLDGQEDLFSAPAFGADFRFNYASRLYATAVASLVVGSAERRYGGAFVENGIYSLDGGYNVNGTSVGRDRSKQNVVLALGLDIGYEVSDNISVGFKGEFAYSHRDLYNPEIADDKIIGSRLLFDGVSVAGSSYNPFGFFAMPYAKLWDFDVMARVSYYKAPYYENYVVDKDNWNLVFDFSVIYNFCDYAGVEFDYIFGHGTEHGYNDDNSVYTFTFNEHSFYLALTGWFDFIWEGKSDAADGE